jgi:uncharacterized damage-inducible protein DinB
MTTPRDPWKARPQAGLLHPLLVQLESLWRIRKMTITELLLAELDREVAASRKALEKVPEGRNDWRPHPRSMPLGSLAQLVAGMPSWIDMVLNMDELDIAPKDGPKYAPTPWKTRTELLDQLETSHKKGREALQKATDERLLTTRWRLLAGGQEMSNQTRYESIRDGVLNHLAHHRGQLTVYLRLNDATVPAVYGPSADERPMAA